jgi:DNA polymerase
MDNVRRLLYLDAMGIDVWVSRMDHGVEKEDTTSIIEQSETVAPAIDNKQDEWQIFQEQVAACQACSLHETRTQTVFGVGNPKADWLLIGEAPGHNEDIQGEPFVGKAGQLLTEMLRAMELNRDQVFIANILKCRPPNNRDPKPEEVSACHGFLQRQIQFIQPKIILAVGRVAAQQLLKTDVPIGKLREKVHYLDKIPVIVIYHPAYLLRSLLEKRKAWQDLQLALKTFRTL